jgi:hypothetical protein
MSFINGKAVAKFTVLTEISVYRYNIQRRLVRGGAWVSCGNVTPLGAPHNYSFTDLSLTPGVWQYRIEEVDLNGKITDFAATKGLTDIIEKAGVVSHPPNPYSTQ